MGMELHIKITNTGSASEHVNSRILTQLASDVTSDLSGNGLNPGSNTKVEWEYIEGEPLEGQVEGAPADFSAEPEAAEEVKDVAETEPEFDGLQVRATDEPETQPTPDPANVDPNVPNPQTVEETNPQTGNAVRADQGESPEAMVHDAPNVPAGEKAAAEYLGEQEQ